jgi:hypothetical protein
MSSRTVWPYLFTLRIAPLLGALEQKNTIVVRDTFFPRGNRSAAPIALRWVTTPELGFAREPFRVFRRAHAPLNMASMTQDGMVQISNANVAVAGTVTIPLAQNDFQYVVVAIVTPATGSSLTVDAVDVSQRTIPSQTVVAVANRVVQFRTPGMSALRVTGNGQVAQIWGIGETRYANLPDWQLIEVVGLPFQNNELGNSYNTLQQGFVTPALDGPTAAIQRLTIAGLLQGDPPPTGVADFPLPAWPVPNPAAYVQSIRSAVPTVAAMIPMAGRCLQWASDSNPNKMQVQYLETVAMPGIKQANVPNAQAGANSTTVRLPIVGVAMLGVSTDSYAAVALGYGTVDIPPASSVPPPITSVDDVNQYDYMVTAPFTFPPPLNTTLTLAALSALHPPVEAPVGISTTIKQVNVPLTRNQAAPASIKLSWQQSSNPQGYGIFASRTPNSAAILNAPRLAGIGGYDSYVAVEPLNPDPNTPPALQLPNFVDTAAVIPLRSPPATTRYLVAGLDVFGLWSGWQQTSVTLAPAGILKPRIRDAEFIMDVANAVGHVVPATLRIDFVWDWQDRAPGQICLSGNFVATNAMLASPLRAGAPANATPTPPFLTGFANSVTGPVGPPVVLTFTYFGQNAADTVAPNAFLPSIDAAHTTSATVTIIAPPAPQLGGSSGSVVRYRLELTSMSLNFTSVNEIAFAVYATGTEQIRPGEWSDANDAGAEGTGRIARALDPIPPIVTFNPPAILWTALPDASGVARGVLQWTPDPKALGYYVWEATESALWDLLSPNTPSPVTTLVARAAAPPSPPPPSPSPPPPATTMVARAAALSTLINNNQDASLQAFARLNKDPIAASRTEVVLPASASTLYVYRISAISAVNVEAPRSTQTAYFAVPRRNTPGIPRLLVRDATTAVASIQVTVTPVESNVMPAGYRVFRVRSSDLSLDGHTMGPPKITEADTGWTNYSDQPRNVTSQRATARGPTMGKTILDVSARPSWYPYYYRATAIGLKDLANGQHSGESGFTPAQSAYSLPPNPPQIVALASQASIFGRFLMLSTDMPVNPSPIGPARVEVLQVIADPAKPGRVTTQSVLSYAPDAIAAGTLGVPALALPAAMRRSPTTNEVWTLYVRTPAASAGTYTLRFTDPLGRQTLHVV